MLIESVNPLKASSNYKDLTITEKVNQLLWEYSNLKIYDMKSPLLGSFGKVQNMDYNTFKL